MSKIKYYIFGPQGIKTKEGSSFELGYPPQLFYYCKENNSYKVTMPDSGMLVIAKPRLKDCKQYILDYWDMIIEIISTKDYIRMSQRFQELVKEKEDRDQYEKEQNNT